jgi:hypothetical protein
MNLEKVFSAIYLNWPFAAVAIILAVVGEVIKSFVVGNRKKDQLKGLRLVYHKTIPIHPVLAGGLLGGALSATIPEELSSGGLVSSVLYFALAGACSTWFYNSVKKILPNFVESVQKKLSGNNIEQKSEPSDEKIE